MSLLCRRLVALLFTQFGNIERFVVLVFTVGLECGRVWNGSVLVVGLFRVSVERGEVQWLL